MLKKLFILSLGILIGSLCSPNRGFADTALIQLDSDGRPVVLKIPDSHSGEAPSASSVTPSQAAPISVDQTASLPPVWPVSYIYYTVPMGPLGSVNLVTPWSAGIMAVGHDFIGNETITQGYLPLVQVWKVTGVFGAGINTAGEGSPMGGAIIDLAHLPISNLADFHVAVTGGYNFNAKHALAVLSGSVQFLK